MGAFAIQIFLENAKSQKPSHLGEKLVMNLTAETFSLLATAIKLLGAGVAIGGGTIGSGIGIGLTVLGALQSIGRNPDAQGQLQTIMFIGIAFCEASAIYAIVIAFILIFVV